MKTDWIIPGLIIISALTASGLALKQHFDSKKSEKESAELSKALIHSQDENLKYALGYGHGNVRVWENQKDEMFKVSFYSGSKYPMFDPEIFVFNHEDLKNIMIKETPDSIYVESEKYNQINTLLYEKSVIKANKIIDLEFKVKKPEPITCLYFNMDYRHGHYIQLTMLSNTKNNGLTEASRVYEVKDSKWELLSDVGYEYENSEWKKNFYIGKIIHGVN